MDDITQIEKSLAGLQDTLVYLKRRIDEAQAAVKKAAAAEQAAIERIAQADEKLRSVVAREIELQKVSEALSSRDAEIRRYEDFELEKINLERAKANLENEKTLFRADMKMRRADIARQVEELQVAKKDLAKKQQEFEQDSKGAVMRFLKGAA